MPRGVVEARSGVCHAMDTPLDSHVMSRLLLTRTCYAAMLLAMELIEQIKEIAEDVYQVLGAGHDEAPYQKAMEAGLRMRGIKYDPQKVVPLSYRGHYVGDCHIDLLVADTVAVELKAVGMPIAGPERQQLRKYMTFLGVMDGVLVNFAQVGRAKKSERLNGKPEVVVVKRVKARRA